MSKFKMSYYERMKDIKPYKTKIHLNCIGRCSSYVTQNIFYVHHQDQSINVVQGPVLISTIIVNT